MSSPLISPENDFALFTCLLVIVAASFWLGRTKLGQIFSPVPFVVILAVAASNLSVLPFKADAYTFASSYLLILAIPLMLFDANLRAIFKVSGGVLSSFFIGVLATMIGCLTAFFIAPLASFSGPVAALYSAVATGGMLNMLSVGEATKVFDQYPELLGALIGGSVLVDVAYLAFVTQATKIRFLSNWFEARSGSGEYANQEPLTTGTSEHKTKPELISIMTALAIAAVICVAGQQLATLLGFPSAAIVIVGTLSVLGANLFPDFFASLKSQQNLGMVMLMTFLAAVTIGSDLGELGGLAFSIFVFVCILYAIHIVLHYSICWFFRIDLPTAITGSIAGIFGPSVTAAITGAKGWQRLLLPGVLCALLGVSAGTYIGLAAFALLV
ncbi:MAG: DUF819 domain-containing protein [Henriciella sp.]